MTTRVLLADDHKIVREGLRALISQERDVEVVGEAETGGQALALARSLRPDVVVMDVSMPELNGIEATRRISAAAPEVKVVALSMHGDALFVKQMLQAGACGYLRKGCSFDELLHAIRLVAAGGIYLTPSAASGLIGDGTQRLVPRDVSPLAVLTPREREVLQLIAEGNTGKRIAILLHVSPKTVSTHRRRIMAKLDAQTTAELTQHAIRGGLIAL
jgi:DNA-binding NarL/FixJ family response regulator